jgi:ribosomal protein S18 acetylase RimI-like enzyme
MSAEYKIKTFSNLTEQEVSTLYDFCSSHQTEDFYSDLNEMKKYYSSNVLNKGENHFSLWVNDDIKACGGYVDLMAKEKNEIYITQAFSAEDNKKYWELLYSNLLSSMSKRLEQAVLDKVYIKLGLRGKSSLIYSWSIDENFLDSDSYEEYLTTIDDTTSNLIYYYNNVPIGISIFAKDDSEIFLDALAVNPEFHSKGYGKLILKYLSSNLKTQGYKSIKLIVANNNAPAYNLYLKYGFVLDKIYVKWMKKSFKK